MKRRCDETQETERVVPPEGETPDNSENPDKGKQTPVAKRYSVRPYIIIMFIAVILLILLSYFIQQRRNNATIDNLTESHSQFSIEALQNIEALQESNLQLTDEVDSLERENSDLQSQVEKLEKDLDTAEEAKTELENAVTEGDQKYQALQAFLELYLAVQNKDDETAKAAATRLQELKEYLAEEYIPAYEELIQGIEME